jgi:hypothetical protein
MTRYRKSVGVMKERSPREKGVWELLHEQHLLMVRKYYKKRQLLMIVCNINYVKDFSVSFFNPFILSKIIKYTVNKNGW